MLADITSVNGFFSPLNSVKYKQILTKFNFEKKLTALFQTTAPISLAKIL